MTEEEKQEKIRKADYVGLTGIALFDGLRIPVTIESRSESYNKLKFLVRPVSECASGSTWVEFKNLIVE